MSEVPGEVVRIVADSIRGRATPFKAQSLAEDVVAALARAGWLCDPAEVAALRAVAEAAREAWGTGWVQCLEAPLAALDALSSAPGGVG